MEVNFSVSRHLIIIMTLLRGSSNYLVTAEIICINGLISIHEALSGPKLTTTQISVTKVLYLDTKSCTTDDNRTSAKNRRGMV